MRVCVCRERVWKRVSESVCVLVRERERECVCVREREREIIQASLELQEVVILIQLCWSEFTFCVMRASLQIVTKNIQNFAVSALKIVIKYSIYVLLLHINAYFTNWKKG